MENIDYWTNRNGVLITRHKKEEVIFPILKPLGLQLSVFDTIDTDQFGSFTGEIPRAGNQLEAAQAKAKKALEVSGENIAISSEGSFGPHPHLSFIPANIELVLFTDTFHGLEIAGWEISSETNFGHAEVTTIEQAIQFSTTIHFPSHGLIVRPNQDPGNPTLFKGITQQSVLEDAVVQCLNVSRDGKARIETDMRAMYNPTRMKVIERATKNLYYKLNSLCPVCAWPGFEITEWIKGLPCENCFRPTRLTLKHVYVCKKCNHKKEIEYPDGKEYCEAQFCDYCNP